MGTYIIEDWMGRTLFEGRKFNSFMEAWSYIYAADPAPDEDDEHYYDDYYVEKI